MVLFFNIIDVSAYNAFVAWMAVNPRWKEGKSFQRRLFLEELGKSMVTPLIQRRQHLPRVLPSATLVRDTQTPGPSTVIGRGKKRKRCAFCAPKDVKHPWSVANAGQQFARHMLNLFVSHVNKFIK